MESIELIEKYTKNLSEGGFTASVQIQDSVIRRLEIIGEAIGKFPEEVKKRHSDIKWNEISGMRNFLIHEKKGQQKFNEAKQLYGQKLKQKIEQEISKYSYKKSSDEDKLKIINNLDSEAMKEVFLRFNFKYIPKK